MNRQVSATEARAKLFALLDDVAADEEIEITRRGSTVARLRPARGPHALKGMFASVVRSAASDEELFTTGAWDQP